LKTKATLCDTGIRRVDGSETTAVGAAMLAGVSAGAFRDLEQAVDAVVRLEPGEIDPDERDREQLEYAYAEYRELFDALESTTA
jgi:sugar (pentulose or hexulose) kinase